AVRTRQRFDGGVTIGDREDVDGQSVEVVGQLIAHVRTSFSDRMVSGQASEMQPQGQLPKQSQPWQEAASSVMPCAPVNGSTTEPLSVTEKTSTARPSRSYERLFSIGPSSSSQC